MREPDELPHLNVLEYYNSSQNMARDIGIIQGWNDFFSRIYRPLERMGVDFNTRVETATNQTNENFQMKVSNGINENDYV